MQHISYVLVSILSAHYNLLVKQCSPYVYPISMSDERLLRQKVNFAVTVAHSIDCFHVVLNEFDGLDPFGLCRSSCIT